MPVRISSIVPLLLVQWSCCQSETLIAARARVALAFTVLDPLARLAGRLRVSRTDLQRREQAELQSQSVGLQGLADLGQGGRCRRRSRA